MIIQCLKIRLYNNKQKKVSLSKQQLFRLATIKQSQAVELMNETIKKIFKKIFVFLVNIKSRK
jgi:hypothetical protein